MKTNDTTHLGDGAYVGLDVNNGHQFWLGANHHEYMTVALGPRELGALILWLKMVAPHILAEAGIQ